MSIIQTIRDKGAKISVALIALALIGFILTDYFAGKNRAQGGSASRSVGSVNGVNVSIEEFDAKVKQMEEYMRQNGSPESPSLTSQAQENTWYNMVNELLYQSELKKLGLTISSNELGDILYGPDAPPDLKRQFTDSATGQYNAALAKSQIDAMLKNKKTPASQKESFNKFVEQLKQQRLQSKYMALFANTVNQPRWYAEAQNSDNAAIAKISYVKVGYADSMFLGSDSTIKVSDKEIEDYLNKHKDTYQVPEDLRTVNYVAFAATPSKEDSAAAIKSVNDLRAEFDSTKNMAEYLAGEGVANFYDGYINGKVIQIGVKDSIFKLPVGGIYGPYIDGNTYTLAKLLGVHAGMPDTVKVRHILISTVQNDPQTGQMVQVRDSASAFKLADSIRQAIAKGSSFDSLCKKFSEDPGSKDKGGVYESVFSGQMVSPFNDAIFLNGVGYKGVVNTQFGSHYIEVLSQKGSGTGYKIAYLPKDILISSQTDADAQNKAMQFAAESHDGVAFDANYEKELKKLGINKATAADIKETDGNIQGVGFSRELVRKIYEASLGEVLKPVKVGENYIVAVVVEINKKGLATVAKARPAIEPILRNQKKAELLKQKIGKITTLEAAAALLKKDIQTADSLRMSSLAVPGLGREPRVIGAAFNPANKLKVVPEALVGGSGVFVVRVDSVGTTPVMNGSVEEIRKNYYTQMKQQVSSQGGPLNALRLEADINDRRASHY